MVEASLKVGGAKEEVAEVPDRILVTTVTLNVIIVVKGDTSLENVQRRMLKI